MAPGLDVATLGVASQGPVRASGPQYAVAFVAGVVALVRGVDPALSAEAVVQRLRATAKPMSGASADARADRRVINLSQAFAGRTPLAAPATSGDEGGVSPLALVISVVLVVLLGVGGMMLFRVAGRARPSRLLMRWTSGRSRRGADRVQPSPGRSPLSAKCWRRARIA